MVWSYSRLISVRLLDREWAWSSTRSIMRPNTPTTNINNFFFLLHLHLFTAFAHKNTNAHAHASAFSDPHACQSIQLSIIWRVTTNALATRHDNNGPQTRPACCEAEAWWRQGDQTSTRSHLVEEEGSPRRPENKYESTFIQESKGFWKF